MCTYPLLRDATSLSRTFLLGISAMAALMLSSPSQAQTNQVALEVLCTLALPISTAATPPTPASGATPESISKLRVDSPLAPDACTSNTATRGVLSGSGDLVVIVSRKSWDSAMKDGKVSPLKPRLFLNGIPSGTDGSLIGVEPTSEGTVLLRFRIAANKTTRAFWMAQYRDRIMTEATPLRVALGWDSTANTLPVDLARAPGPNVRVTTEGQEKAAFITIGLLAAFFLWALFGSDLFRDAPAQAHGSKPAVFSLWTKPVLKRATFSLARLQTGLWLFFIVAAGLFIRLVLGVLPSPEPTIVALLGLCAATMAVSMAVDSSAGTRPYIKSSGLLSDLVTGWDGTQQLHRVQAIVVNLVLLIIAFDSVIKDLAYPVFDGAWLALLGVSAVAQTAGKQVLEANQNPAGSNTVNAPLVNKQGTAVALPGGRTV